MECLLKLFGKIKFENFIIGLCNQKLILKRIIPLRDISVENKNIIQYDSANHTSLP